MWEDEEEFRDIPEETELDVQGQPLQSSPAQVSPTVYADDEEFRDVPEDGYDGPVVTEYLEDTAPQASEDDEEDYSEVLSDARIRLEQGRLYEMIMNHELFKDVDADPRAVKSVQKQIRKFAKEQMEVMLGMRQTTYQAPALNNPFNGLEIDVLKKLASAASKGATESEEAETIAEVVAPKKKTLNSIGVSPARKLVKSAPRPVSKIETRTAPLARKKSTLPAEFEPDYEALKKHPSEMSEAEVLERNRQTTKRQEGRKLVKNPKGGLPMPSYEQTNALYTQRMATDVKKSNLVSTIMTLMNNK